MSKPRTNEESLTTKSSGSLSHHDVVVGNGLTIDQLNYVKSNFHCPVHCQATTLFGSRARSVLASQKRVYKSSSDENASPSAAPSTSPPTIPLGEADLDLSDADITCFMKELPQEDCEKNGSENCQICSLLTSSRSGTVFACGIYFTYCAVPCLEAEVDWFTNPRTTIAALAGLEDCCVLFEEEEEENQDESESSSASSLPPSSFLQRIKERARNFHWTDKFVEKRRKLALEDLVGWLEELFKVLSGFRKLQTLLSRTGEGEAVDKSLCRQQQQQQEQDYREYHYNVGKILNGRHGLSFGLTGVMNLWYGVLLRSDNSFLLQLHDTLLQRSSDGGRQGRRISTISTEEPDEGLKEEGPPLLAAEANSSSSSSSFEVLTREWIAHSYTAFGMASPAYPCDRHHDSRQSPTNENTTSRASVGLNFGLGISTPGPCVKDQIISGLRLFLITVKLVQVDLTPSAPSCGSSGVEHLTTTVVIPEEILEAVHRVEEVLLQHEE